MVKIRDFFEKMGGGVLVIALSFLPLLVGCPPTGGSGTGIGGTENYFTIVFDETKIKADYYDDGNEKWQDFKSGNALPKETRIDFYPINLGENDTVDKWIIGTQAPQEPNRNGVDFWFTEVNKNIADTSGIINVSYTTRIAEKFILNFDDNKIRAGYWDESKNEAIEFKNNDKVKENLNIYFEAIEVGADKVVDKWNFGSVEEYNEYEPNEYNIIIGKEYTTGNNINVDFTTRNAETYKLEFDASIMHCIYYNDYNKSTANDQPKNNGETVKEGDWLTFKLNDGIEAKNWFVGGNKMRFNGNNCWFAAIKKYTIDNGSEKIIKIENRELGSFKLQFNENKIEVKIKKSGNWQKITDGTDIQEGTRLRIEAINLNGKVFDNWKIGTTTVPNKYLSNRLRNYQIAKTGDIVNIDYDIREPNSYTIEFDSEKVSCRYEDPSTGWTSLETNAPILEGARLRLDAKDLGNQVVTNWSIGTENDFDEWWPNSLWINIAKEYINSEDKLVISYTTKEAKKYTITFDETKIEITNDDGKILHTSNILTEGSGLYIKAKAGVTVDKWLIGTETAWNWTDNEGFSRCNITCVDGWADNGTINIDYTTK